jgi:hypothetical protein
MWTVASDAGFSGEALPRDPGSQQFEHEHDDEHDSTNFEISV